MLTALTLAVAPRAGIAADAETGPARVGVCGESTTVAPAGGSQAVDGAHCEPDAPPSAEVVHGIGGDVADDRFGVLGFPIIGFTPETDWAFAALGMLNWRFANCTPQTRVSSLTGAATYTLRRQWLVQLASSMYTRCDRFLLGGEFLVSRWRNDYFGLGDDSRASDREVFVRGRLGSELYAERAIVGRTLYAGLRFEAERVRVFERRAEGLLETNRPDGWEGGVISGVGISAVWDTRDVGFFPTRGAYVEGMTIVYDGLIGSDFDFTRGAVDARTWLAIGRGEAHRAAIWNGRHILALRGTVTAHAGRPPIWEMATFGGMFTMRGISEGRVRDLHALTSQLEYRTPFLWRFGLVAFGSAGDVFGQRRLDLDDLWWTAGTGLRFAIDPDHGVNLRFDYGRSYEENGFYLAVTEAF